jgi:heme/copper-type cytochrome/quinol oxidase subunit 2
MKKFYKKITSHLLSLMVFLLPAVVWAQQGGYNPTNGAALENPLKAENIDSLVTAGMNIVIYIGAIVAVLAIIWVGFMYVKAMGKPDAIKDAHRASLYTAIGIAILVGAQVITTIITSTINQIRN